MRRLGLVVAMAVSACVAAGGGAAEIDGLPPMAWGETAAVVVGDGFRWVGPEPLSEDLSRWRTLEEMLGRQGELSMLFRDDRLVGWRMSFDLEDACDTDAARRLYDQLLWALDGQISGEPTEDHVDWGEGKTDRATWRHPTLAVGLWRTEVSGVSRVDVVAAPLVMVNRVWVATDRLVAASFQDRSWRPSMRWGTPFGEVVGDDPGWSAPEHGPEGVTLVTTGRFVFGRPAHTIVLFMDDRLAGWGSVLTVPGGLEAVSTAFDDLRRVFEAAYGDPTIVEGSILVWDTDVERVAIAGPNSGKPTQLGLAAICAPAMERLDWAIRLLNIGVAESGFPRPGAEE